MSNATRAAELSVVAEKVGVSLVEDFGGFLRCETCGRRQSLNAEQGGRYMSAGWPTCCDLTMQWWTARQIRDGEVPA